MSWLDEAICVDFPLDMFFPKSGEDAQPAKDICHQCPVEAECLVDALSKSSWEDQGVRGGMSQRQRDKARKGLYKRSVIDDIRTVMAGDPDRWWKVIDLADVCGRSDATIRDRLRAMSQDGEVETRQPDKKLTEYRWKR